MPVYFVADIRITDPAEYGKYLDACDDVFARFNGRYLAVDLAPLVLEGTRAHGRAVIIEFPSEADLLRWYRSAEYREVLAHRLKGADCDTVVVRGKG
jgi:uncharacterized protein (DUF1330 family)